MIDVFTGLFLSLLAGLATVIGGLIVFFIKKPKDAYLAFALAFSTGVMLTVSFLELLPAGILSVGYTYGLIVFFAGAAFAFLIDYVVPHRFIMEDATGNKDFDPKLFRVGMFVALGMAIHNFPEGFAVFAGSLQSIGLGITIAVAIAIHNIPEGIAVAIPVYYATKKKAKALFISFLSGITEPIGALIGALILLPFLSAQVIGASLALVAGIMVYICIDELMPAAFACARGKAHLMTFAFLLGSIVMGTALILI
ncbi:MAG TPA: zinc transporter ZupT [archaeon]|nr:zinc transporter ZupT [archaeon]